MARRGETYWIFAASAMMGWNYLRVLEARCCCSRKPKSEKAVRLAQARNFVAPALLFTLLGKLALASLFALEPIVETRTRHASWNSIPDR